MLEPIKICKYINLKLNFPGITMKVNFIEISMNNISRRQLDSSIAEYVLHGS